MLTTPTRVETQSHIESHSTPLTALEDEITTLCAHLGAAEHRLLTAIGEFDARHGWVGLGIASCAHWLSWKCGVSLPAAHEKVRVARALRGLPEIAAGMARGELSYSKVRAITRVATVATEGALVRLARQGTASHVEEIVRRYRRVTHLADAEAAAKAQRNRELRYHWDDDGSLVLHGRLPAEQGALVLQALQAAGEALRAQAGHDEPQADDPHVDQSSAEDSRPVRAMVPAHSSAEDSASSVRRSPGVSDQSFAARRADALVLMAETVLRNGPAELPAAERHCVVIHVDAAALAGATQDAQCELEHGPALAIESARRLLCDASIVTLHEEGDGNALDVGRKTRAIPTALRRALKSRDRGCRFPGCSHKRFTDAHHVRHWANGGETKLENLVLLCRVHHRLVHEDGFTVEQGAAGFCFRTPDGRRVEDAPLQRILMHDPVLALMASHVDRGITARTCVPEWMGEVPAYDWITDGLWRRDHGPQRRPHPD